MTPWALPHLSGIRLDDAVAEAEAAARRLAQVIDSFNGTIAVYDRHLQLLQLQAEAARQQVADVIREALEPITAAFNSRSEAWQEGDEAAAISAWRSRWIDYANSLEAGVAILNKPEQPVEPWGLFPFTDLPRRAFREPDDDQAVSSPDGMSPVN
jgi:hypothetical protein